jgi:hypothetical protein
MVRQGWSTMSLQQEDAAIKTSHEAAVLAVGEALADAAQGAGQHHRLCREDREFSQSITALRRRSTGRRAFCRLSISSAPEELPRTPQVSASGRAEGHRPPCGVGSRSRTHRAGVLHSNRLVRGYFCGPVARHQFYGGESNAAGCGPIVATSRIAATNVGFRRRPDAGPDDVQHRPASCRKMSGSPSVKQRIRTKAGWCRSDRRGY